MRRFSGKTHPDSEDVLKRLYGPLAGRHHARYHRPDVPSHFIFRTFQGRPLLIPGERLRTIAAGVLGRALGLEAFDSIRLYAYAALSSHVHLMLRGNPEQIPRFVAYLKRELTLRWGPVIGWSDSLWHRGYISTALPTAESQQRCFEYILAHGVKEGIVSRPEQWSGLHMAHEIVRGAGGAGVAGVWVNGTTYGKALWKDRQRPEARRKGVDKAEHTERVTLTLSVLPCWESLTEAELEAELADTVMRVVIDGELARNGAPPKGMDHACRLPLDLQMPLPKLPWFEEREGFICWADPTAPETIAYVGDYWEFQLAFRAAANVYLAGNRDVEFPSGAFKPVVPTPFPPGSGAAAA